MDDQLNQFLRQSHQDFTTIKTRSVILNDFLGKAPEICDSVQNNSALSEYFYKGEITKSQYIVLNSQEKPQNLNLKVQRIVRNHIFSNTA